MPSFGGYSTDHIQCTVRFDRNWIARFRPLANIHTYLLWPNFLIDQQSLLLTCLSELWHHFLLTHFTTVILAIHIPSEIDGHCNHSQYIFLQLQINAHLLSLPIIKISNFHHINPCSQTWDDPEHSVSEANISPGIQSLFEKQ